MAISYKTIYPAGTTITTNAIETAAGFDPAWAAKGGTSLVFSVPPSGTDTG
jgi:hypothetical protein